jgi:vancomycin resistance protein VanJ
VWWSILTTNFMENTHLSVDNRRDLERLAILEKALSGTWKQRTEKLFLCVTRFGVWMYVLGAVACWLAMWLEGDRWWLATILLFGPRWFGLLPLVVLAPLALVLRARLLLPLSAVGMLFVFGVMGLCVPWPWKAVETDASAPVSVLTCNMRGGAGGWDALRRVVDRERPDIVAIQEPGNGDGMRLPENWHVERQGQLIIASPYPIRDVQRWQRKEPPSRWPPLVALYAVIDRPGRSLAICNVHLTSPHHGLAEVLDGDTIVSPSRSETLTELNYWRHRESEMLTEWIATLPRIDVLAGDFNMPVESRIYRQFWSRYTNAFSTVGFGFGYTRWASLRNVGFGVRIDHVLTGQGWAPISCELGPDVGSDHLPVLAKVGPEGRRD